MCYGHYPIADPPISTLAGVLVGMSAIMKARTAALRARPLIEDISILGVYHERCEFPALGGISWNSQHWGESAGIATRQV